MLNPETLPYPGKGGGPKAKARAPGIAANFLVHSRANALACNSGALRSSHGLSQMNISAEFGKFNEFRMFMPATATDERTPSVLPTIDSICFSVASVRWSEAP